MQWLRDSCMDVIEPALELPMKVGADLRYGQKESESTQYKCIDEVGWYRRQSLVPFIGKW